MADWKRRRDVRIILEIFIILEFPPSFRGLNSELGSAIRLSVGDLSLNIKSLICHFDIGSYESRTTLWIRIFPSPEKEEVIPRAKLKDLKEVG